MLAESRPWSKPGAHLPRIRRCLSMHPVTDASPVSLYSCSAMFYGTSNFHLCLPSDSFPGSASGRQMFAGGSTASQCPPTTRIMLSLSLPTTLYNDTEALKSAAATMRSNVEEATGGGAVVVVVTVAKVEGSLGVADDITEDDRADLLASLEAVACQDVPDCTVMWGEAGGRRRRRILRRSLATVTLQYTVRLELDATNPEVPKARHTRVVTLPACCFAVAAPHAAKHPCALAARAFAARMQTNSTHTAAALLLLPAHGADRDFK